jgi:methionine salvage enolase-phosphatase E1
MIEFRGRLILLDIEGTVSPLAFATRMAASKIARTCIW